MFRLSSFLLWTAVFVAITTTNVEARDMVIYKTKNLIGAAWADIADECITGWVRIDGSSYAMKDKTTSEGKPSKSYDGLTYAQTYQYNRCKEESMYGYVLNVDPSSTFAGDHKGATASATISTLYRCSYQEVEGGDLSWICGEWVPADVTIEIEATWTAKGSIITERSTSSYDTEWYSFKYSSTGTTREDTTITLQITQDGVALDLDPSPVSGGLYWNSFGSMTIYRNED